VDRLDRPDWSVLRSMVSDLKRATSNLHDSRDRILRIRGRAWSDDRLVKAVVGPRGQLIELEIDPRVFRNPNSKALAATIVATVRAAVEDSLRQGREIRDELLPADLRSLAERGPSGQDLLSVHDADLEDKDA
jgi:hypothetical protein